MSSSLIKRGGKVTLKIILLQWLRPVSYTHLDVGYIISGIKTSKDARRSSKSSASIGYTPANTIGFGFWFPLRFPRIAPHGDCAGADVYKRQDEGYPFCEDQLQGNLQVPCCETWDVYKRQPLWIPAKKKTLDKINCRRSWKISNFTKIKEVD